MSGTWRLDNDWLNQYLEHRRANSAYGNSNPQNIVRLRPESARGNWLHFAQGDRSPPPAALLARAGSQLTCAG